MQMLLKNQLKMLKYQLHLVNQCWVLANHSIFQVLENIQQQITILVRMLKASKLEVNQRIISEMILLAQVPMILQIIFQKNAFNLQQLPVVAKENNFIIKVFTTQVQANIMMVAKILARARNHSRSEESPKIKLEMKFQDQAIMMQMKKLQKAPQLALNNLKVLEKILWVMKRKLNQDPDNTLMAIKLLEKMSHHSLWDQEESKDWKWVQALENMMQPSILLKIVLEILRWVLAKDLTLLLKLQEICQDQEPMIQFINSDKIKLLLQFKAKDKKFKETKHLDLAHMMRIVE